MLDLNRDAGTRALTALVNDRDMGLHRVKAATVSRSVDLVRSLTYPEHADINLRVAALIALLPLDAKTAIRGLRDIVAHVHRLEILLDLAEAVQPHHKEFALEVAEGVITSARADSAERLAALRVIGTSAPDRAGELATGLARDTRNAAGLRLDAALLVATKYGGSTKVLRELVRAGLVPRGRLVSLAESVGSLDRELAADLYLDEASRLRGRQRLEVQRKAMNLHPSKGMKAVRETLMDRRTDDRLRLEEARHLSAAFELDVYESLAETGSFDYAFAAAEKVRERDAARGRELFAVIAQRGSLPGGNRMKAAIASGDKRVIERVNRVKGVPERDRLSGARHLGKAGDRVRAGLAQSAEDPFVRITAAMELSSDRRAADLLAEHSANRTAAAESRLEAAIEARKRNRKIGNGALKALSEDPEIPKAVRRRAEKERGRW
ncbi:hypothetical protein LV79_006531 [Actinokineospora globicatena]|nr:hypothetical protein [Actinokineospora globicatena]